MLEPQGECHILAKVIQEPWCDDVADGSKWFECVANKLRWHNQFKQLVSGDLFVILRPGLSLTAVGRVSAAASPQEVNRGILYSKVGPERRKALDAYLGDAETFDYVLFDEIYDCRKLNMNVYGLLEHVDGLKLPSRWNGPAHLSVSPVVHGQLEGFLAARCPVRLYCKWSCGCSTPLGAPTAAAPARRAAGSGMDCAAAPARRAGGSGATR